MNVVKTLIFVSNGTTENGHRLTAGSYAGTFNTSRMLERYLTVSRDVAVLTTKKPMFKQISDEISSRIITKIFDYSYLHSRDKYNSIKSELLKAFRHHSTVIIVIAPDDVDNILAYFYQDILCTKKAPPRLEYTISSGVSLVVNEEGVHWLMK